MTEFITVSHPKAGRARVPKQTLDIWSKQGWKQIKDPAGVAPDSPHLPDPEADENPEVPSGTGPAT
jgi:hypothetical protein